MSLEVNADDVVLDGEIVKLDRDGRPIFVDLMRRRGPFTFVAFDVLVANGKDIRKLALADRKKILRAIVPRESRSVLYAQHVKGRGPELFDVVCKRISKGLSRSIGGVSTAPTNPASGSRLRNPEYSQARDRAELFER